MKKKIDCRRIGYLKNFGLLVANMKKMISRDFRDINQKMIFLLTTEKGRRVALQM
ncbi:hypothetical protein ACFLSP_00835 [Bacteroidota bacterium]